jgi:hypothetical protein
MPHRPLLFALLLSALLVGRLHRAVQLIIFSVRMISRLNSLHRLV